MRKVMAVGASRRPGRGTALRGRRRLAWTLALALPVAAALAPAPAAGQETHVLIVAGLGGAEPYRTTFPRWAAELHTGLVQRHGTPAGNVVVLAERADAHPVVRGRSTRDDVLSALAGMAGKAGPRDRLLVLLIGHGTAQGQEARLNLPGPDLTPDDLDAALMGFPTQSIAVVHTGSASGGFVDALSGPNRIVVAATRNALERNATEFPRYFVEAVTTGGADLDKDGRISLLEAYEYATLEVARFYDQENEILTEHAVLDDNGDGVGSRQPIRDGEDGPRAATFHFGSGPGASATTVVPSSMDPELNRLYGERADIQGRIDDLRARKDGMGAEAYEDQLEALLVELALKAREIRAREAGSGPGGDA